MVNTEALDLKIKECGVKKSYIAERLGITNQSLWKKITNQICFSYREIMILCDILRIGDMGEMQNFFGSM